MYMDSVNTVLLLVFATIFFARSVTASHVQEIVSPTCNSSTPSCVTLTEFLYLHSSSLNIVLLPGVHTLGSHTAENGAHFLMTGTPGKTIVNCTRYRYNLHLNRISTSITINGITFQGCSFYIRNSGNTYISRSVFSNNSLYGSLRFADSYNISVDQSSFRNNHPSYSSDSVLQITRSENVAITHTNFTTNGDSRFRCCSSRAVLSLNSISSGYTSCCNFHNNTVNSYSGGVLRISSSLESQFFVTNSSFTENSALSSSSIIRSTSSVTIVRSTFFSNTAGSYGIVQISGGVGTIIASNFVNNVGSLTSRVYTSQMFFDCTGFLQNSAPVQTALLSIHNSVACATRYKVDTCQSNSSCKECRPPRINVTMEFTKYSIKENIQSTNFVLQVCAIADYVPFEFEVSMKALINGTAEDAADFRSLNLTCGSLKFTVHQGIQKRCSYFEILDDDLVETEEQFIVELSSTNPQVDVIDGEATVSIVDDDGDDEEPTNIAATTITVPGSDRTGTESCLGTPVTEIRTPVTEPEPPATETGAQAASKIVLVECGIFSRPVTFSDSIDDFNSLHDAIVRTFSFSGLESKDIALLQMSSTEEYFLGHFVDLVDSNMRIEHNSVIRVVPYSKNKSICSM